MTSFEERVMNMVLHKVDAQLDDNELLGRVSSVLNLDQLISEVLEEDPVKEACKAKLRTLIVKSIEGVDSLDELGIEIDYFEDLDAEMIPGTLKDVLEQENIQEALKQKLTKLLFEYIGSLDDDVVGDLFDHISFDQPFQRLQSDPMFNQKLEKVIAKGILSVLEDDFSSDDLPDGWKARIGLGNTVSLVLDQARDDQTLPNMIQQQMSQILSEGMVIRDILSTSPEVQELVVQHLQEVFRDSKFLSELKELLKNSFRRNNDFQRSILEGIFAKFGEALFEKLFPKQ